jgi:hypothetical protein
MGTNVSSWGRRCGDYVAVNPPGNSEARIICNIEKDDFSIHVKFLNLQELRAISAKSLLGLGSSLILCTAFPAYRRNSNLYASLIDWNGTVNLKRARYGERDVKRWSHLDHFMGHQ